MKRWLLQPDEEQFFQIKPQKAFGCGGDWNPGELAPQVDALSATSATNSASLDTVSYSICLNS